MLRICSRRLFATTLICMIGCSSKGSVSGRVTFEGVPVRAAVISFHSLEGNRPVINAVVRDGDYTIDDLPTGKALVTVVPQGASQKAGGDGKHASKTAGSPPRLPARYADPVKSDASLVIQGKHQTFDLNLTP